jgi:hypothetical protein
MPREKKTTHGVVPGGHAKDRHRRNGLPVNWALVQVQPWLQAKPDKPVVSSKHQSYFEFVDNKDKKKKLEFKVGRIGSWTKLFSRNLTVTSIPMIANLPPGSSLYLLGIQN